MRKFLYCRSTIYLTKSNLDHDGWVSNSYAKLSSKLFSFYTRDGITIILGLHVHGSVVVVVICVSCRLNNNSRFIISSALPVVYGNDFYMKTCHGVLQSCRGSAY